jgi:Transcription factor WhiB
VFETNTQVAWRTLAVCKGADPNLFQPEKETPREEIALTIATYCDACPVKEQCLDHAVENNEKGIWGGTTETRRRKMRRARGLVIPGYRPLQPCGTLAAYRRHIEYGTPICEACDKVSKAKRKSKRAEGLGV